MKKLIAFERDEYDRRLENEFQGMDDKQVRWQAADDYTKSHRRLALDELRRRSRVVRG